MLAVAASLMDLPYLRCAALALLMLLAAGAAQAHDAATPGSQGLWTALFASLIFAYLYLWTVSLRFWLGSADTLPRLGYALAAAAAQIGTSAAIAFGSRALQPLAQAPSRDFIGWLSAAIVTLVLVALLWETLALVWLPACG